jgi:hypothetical protein
MICFPGTISLINLFMWLLWLLFYYFNIDFSLFYTAITEILSLVIYKGYLFLTVLEAGKSKINVLTFVQAFLLCPYMMEEQERLNPLTPASLFNLGTHLQLGTISQHCCIEIELPHRSLEGIEHFSFSTGFLFCCWRKGSPSFSSILIVCYLLMTHKWHSWTW